MINGILKDKRDIIRVFLIAAVLSTIIFLPFVIFDKGLFIYYGDFDVQQIPFYKLCHEAIRSGSFGWNWNTDLGVNFVGSYSFYTLGSPFFWLTIPFPNDWVPYLMAPLYVLKFSLTAVTGYAFINRFTKTSSMAAFGGLLYAFSGFNIYNVFFNHFNEVVLIFPLLLISLEEFVVNNRRGGFALTVALCAVVNYYFFFGEVIFCIIYFLVRLRSHEFSMNLKKFLWLAGEAVLGLLLSMFMLLPALAALTGNPRPGDTIEGFNTLIYGNAQRYGLILSSLFFPPDIPARPNFFPDSNAKWSSVSLFLPMLSTVGVFAFLKGKKKSFIKTLLITSGIIALVPFLNAAFSAFNYGYYARWFFMPLLFMALASVIALEDHMDEMPFGLKVTAGFVAFFMLIGIMPKRVDGELKWFSLPEYPERFWVYVLVALFGLLCVWLLIVITKKHKHFLKIAMSCFFVITFAYSGFIIFCGKTEGHGYDVVAERGLYGSQKISLPKDEFYRIDTYEQMDNLGMFLKMPTINAFHSIVPSSIIDYYELIGGERGVASRPETSKIGVRALASVKYSFIADDDKNTSAPIGFEYLNTQDGYKIYENKNFVPMGFGYDYMISKEQMASAGEYKDRLLLKGIYLDPENSENPDLKPTDLLEKTVDTQAIRYANILPDLEGEEASHSTLSTKEDYEKSCEKLKSNTVKNFTYDGNGFWATYKAPKEQLLFFSVPFDSGFSATVNGKDVEIIKANGGFMAVEVSKGDNAVVFSYRTPGLFLGTMISLGALIIFAVYIGAMYFLWRKNPAKYRYERDAHLPNQEPSIDAVFISEAMESDEEQIEIPPDTMEEEMQDEDSSIDE